MSQSDSEILPPEQREPAEEGPTLEGGAARGLAAPLDLAAVLRTPVLVGLVVIAVFFLGLGGWAAVAPLASSAIAPGVVSADAGSRRTVQHFEGGIIDEFRVAEGDKVTAGEPLLYLRDIAAGARYQELRKRFYSLRAEETRLLAEQRGRDEIRFPDGLKREASRAPEVAAALQSQIEIFETRRESLKSRKAILRQRIAQLEEEIAGRREQIQSQNRQLELIAEEIEGVRELVEKGLGRKPRLLGLQRRQAQIVGARADNRARIAQARKSIGETEMQILQLEADRRERLSETLSEVQDRLASLTEQLRQAEDVLKRTVITAPVSGEVVELRFSTPGGVIRPGEPILDIVPQDEELIIDARVRPRDIDVVEPGLRAQVVLTAYRQRNLPRIEGRVKSVSADSITEEETGETYYQAKITVEETELDRLRAVEGGAIELSPGMPAEVMIMTGERTALAYLLQPVRDSFRRAFRES